MQTSNSNSNSDSDRVVATAEKGSATTPRTTQVSACGKVLLVGGYVVLESPNPGLVVAVDKRFYAMVETAPVTGGGGETDDAAAATTATAGTTTRIVVKSPQFHSEWSYEWGHGTGILEPSVENPSTNKFVENSLTLLCLYRPPISPIVWITIRADNDFYSVLPHLGLHKPTEEDQRQQQQQQDNPTPPVVVTKSIVSGLPKFLNCPRDSASGKVSVNKTGLGSSAALTTSLVGAWCLHHDRSSSSPSPFPPAGGLGVVLGQRLLAEVHNLSQICHCWAQGKIGSGFDVSSAVYGTHVYRRFSKCLLGDFLQRLERHGTGRPAPDSGNDDRSRSDIRDQLYALVTAVPWEDGMQTPLDWRTAAAGAAPASAASQLQIVLADVCGGSESPSMARLVLQWKELHPGIAGPIWASLKDSNSRVIELMRGVLAAQEKEDGSGSSCWDEWSHQTSKEWPETSGIKQLSEEFRKIRGLMKKMGESVFKMVVAPKHKKLDNGDDTVGAAAGKPTTTTSSIPIEPDEQTLLCDRTMELPGVVAAVVPGAGGYDAIACVYIDRPNVLRGIEELWSEFSTGATICPLGAEVSNSGLRIEKE